MPTATKTALGHPDDGHTRRLTLQEAALSISASVKTVRRRIADRELPAYVCGKRGIRVKRDDLDDLMKPI